MSVFLIANIVATVIAIVVLIVSVFVIYGGSPDSFNRDCAVTQNHYRYLHRSPFLTVSKTLVAYAEKRADEMKSTGIFSNSANGLYGESLYKESYYNLKGDEKNDKQRADDLNCQKVSKVWYREVRHYDFAKGETTQPGKPITHFTQMVWMDTRHIGCAKSFDATNRTTYWVCNYEPKGNVAGSYVQNVPQRHT